MADHEQLNLTSGVVVARWGDERVMLELASGATVDADATSVEQAAVDVGHPVFAVVGADQEIQRWWVDKRRRQRGPRPGRARHGRRRTPV